MPSSFWQRKYPRCEKAVRRVKRTVCRLDDGRIVVLPEPGFIIGLGVTFEMPGPSPRPPLVIGQRDGQTIPSALEIVVDQDPVAVSEDEHFGARARVRELGVFDRAPRFSAVC